MLKIWGRPTSLNSIKVLWCLDELSLDYKVELSGLGHRSLDDPAYLQLNPNQMVPTIVDNGFILWESHAIIRYLAAKYGFGMLYPADLQARADADKWMEWMVQNIKYRLRAIFHNRFRPGSPDGGGKAAAQGLLEIGHWWDILNIHLSDRKFVAGDCFTMGDIPLGCAVYRYREMVPERPKMPYLDTWYERLAARPAYQCHVMQPLA
ncbi:MAG: glutathione S-transferase [Rhodospirillaceae bacterium]|nr:glutathione S-transferase [Rhodospirillaceae bacterium]|tara:strand:+ start:69 stop:689 length:621 start_codon:yes stop_codon:yes gene_type:complete